jgi:uncharacterized protein YybS (DUF2232 family)
MSDIFESGKESSPVNLPQNLSESLSQNSPQIESESWELESSESKVTSDKNEDFNGPLMMVETAFLASTASLIWFVNYYFPLGPLLRIFFPVPIALVYLRWGRRSAWMGALVSGLLLSVLMGPTRSILFVIPFGFLSVLLGGLWRGGASWLTSISLGTVVGSFGFFFRFWLLSILLGEDLWLYITSQATELVEWVFVKLGLLAVPSLSLVQGIAVGMIVLNNIVYLFVVHLVALLLLDRLGNPIPRPPNWVQILINYED